MLSRWTVLTACLLAQSQPARGAVVDWVNPNGGSWFVATNWSGGTVPVTGDTARFALNSSYAVFWEQPPLDRASLDFVAGVLDIGPSNYAAPAGPESAFVPADLRIAAGAAQHATVRMRGGGIPRGDDGLPPRGLGSVLIGTGSESVGELELVQGNQLWTLNGVTVGGAGTGKLTIREGSGVRFPGAGYASIYVADGSSLVISDATTSLFNLGISVAGEAVVENGAQIDFNSTGGAGGSGTFRIRGAGTTVHAEVAAGAAFGLMEVSDGGTFSGQLLGGFVRVIENGTVLGAGSIQNAFSSVEVIGPNALYSLQGNIWQAGPFAVTQGGVAHMPIVAAAGTATGPGSVVSCSVVVGGGSILVEANARLVGIQMIGGYGPGAVELAGGVVAGGATLYEGGRLSGYGTWTGPLNNAEGVVAPAPALTVLVMEGPFAQGPNGTLLVRCVGGQLGQLECDTPASMGGTLLLDFSASVPPPGTVSAIVRAPVVTGTFSAVQTLGLPNGVEPLVEYFTDRVTIRFPGPPSIDQQPVPASNCPARSQSYTVAAAGAGTLSYTWRRAGTPINLADPRFTVVTPGDGASSVLTISPIRLSDAASDANGYDCVVSSLAGIAVSSRAGLFLLPDLFPDGAINTIDLAVILGNFGQTVAPWTLGDLTGDGLVNTADLVLFLGQFGQACP